ncbi:MFS transporter [Clostridiaceae bacterium UIB06]|uniref:MFS transporter n=1 Tax=Clostridium thailandense TaxID=2794346 RepID=A0A949WQ90_9CLOT|nr:MFS transporter [Clostridium thailandense]MBV7272451.1 MFS transporter [Clostridium thailandense]MCH5136975.1 MFS transporter [Clostridiaceae bacterium UIB06]
METKKRKCLAVLTLGVILIIVLFLWITNKGQPIKTQVTLNITLVILSGFAVVALMLFIFFGEIFNEDGSMQKNQIILMLTTVICIIQITLAFATYSFKQLDFENESLQKAKGIFLNMKSQMPADNFDIKKVKTSDEISSVYIINEKNIVQNSTDKAQIGKNIEVDPLKSYRFPNGNLTVVMDISEEYQKKMVRKILLDLLTVLIASVILTFELVIFIIKFIEDKFEDKEVKGRKSSYKMVRYVRQIAFLFYFSSRMAITFITIMAKNLGGSFFGFKGNVLAGIPQSAELLLTCVAIFATSIIIEKKGWKLSFVGGLFVVALGTLMSAFSTNIALFIISRGIVGFGYGFCWMTLRNFALFTSNDNDKSICFAMLNAGIYAGINCGAVFGSILADIIGYVPVLITASALTLVCTAAVLGLENATYQRQELEKQEVGNSISEKYDLKGVVNITFFIILMIVPSCILGSYIDYYVPIYFTNIGKMTSDIGRSQLIYGLIIVYVGPYIVRFLNKYPNLFRWNIAYNVIFSLALILFGLVGGFVPAMLAVMALGVADSFGFVAQNNYFLNLRIVKQLGESRALSYISIIKKFAAMLGPIAFGLSFMGGDFRGVAILGITFALAVVIYVLISKSGKLFRWRESS